MTGYGCGEFATAAYLARIEITAVNRKQADIVINLPRQLAELEASLKKEVLKSVSRGRITASILIERTASAAQAVSVDEAKVKALESAFAQISTLLNRPILPQASDFLKTPGIVNLEDAGIDPDEAAAAINPALKIALTRLNEMRSAEGDDLKTDFISRLETLENKASLIAEASDLVLARQRELLHQRLREAGLDCDLNDERVLKEIALFAERCDIAEETTRLVAHFKRFREFLASSEPVGRPLDFLCQELNREFNTIGSKANDAGIAQEVVHSKTELEKIREQVQNIE